MPDLEAIEKFLKAEWDVISGAPFHFSVAVIGIGILIWLVQRFLCKQQVIGLENENRAKDETIRTLGERVTLAQEKFEAVDQVREQLETRFNDLDEAVERDAAKRDQEVSPDVATAVSATESTIQNLKSSERELRNQLHKLTDITIDPTDWPYGATKPKDLFEDEDKDKD